MNIAVITVPGLKEELLAQGLPANVQITWLGTPAAVPGAECYIDLLFENDEERVIILKQLQPALVIVNEVVVTCSDLPPGFVRINGWPTFLQRAITEAAATSDYEKKRAEKILALFGKKPSWVPDLPGFVTARVISMIVNEAYFALGEDVSTKAEIDTAMKLGTNYPHGPFEWSEKIGLHNIRRLLNELSGTESRYQPAPLLEKETSTQ